MGQGETEKQERKEVAREVRSKLKSIVVIETEKHTVVQDRANGPLL